MRFFLKKFSRFNFPYLLLGVVLLLLVDGFMLFRWFIVTQKSVSDIEPVALNLHVSDLVSRLSLEEKVGQIIMVNYYGDDEEKLRRLFELCYPGGIMLKGENTKNKNFQALKQQNAWLQSFSDKIPLWISVDQEGGQVSRLRAVLKNYPAPPELFRKKGVRGVEEQAIYYAQKLKELGIQIDFSPVVDVVENRESIIADRSFSSSVHTNAMLGKLFVDRFLERGVIAVPKHFPGYGNVIVDPHEALSIDTSSDLNVMESVFVPLFSAELIMTSHVVYENFDRDPATLSPVILGRLRKAGFTNLIITDDIQMKSITLLYDYDKAAVKAVQAGCDIVLSITKSESDWLERAVRLHSALVRAYKDGRLDEHELDLKVAKILNFKFKSNPYAKWALLNASERDLVGLGKASKIVKIVFN